MPCQQLGANFTQTAGAYTHIIAPSGTSAARHTRHMEQAGLNLNLPCSLGRVYFFCIHMVREGLVMFRARGEEVFEFRGQFTGQQGTFIRRAAYPGMDGMQRSVQHHNNAGVFGHLPVGIGQ